MAADKHSFIRFYPRDWEAGVARLTRLQKSIYFDICLHNWSTGEPLGRADAAEVFADVPDIDEQLKVLLRKGKIQRTKGGGLFSDRALIEVRWARDRLEMAKRAGKEGAKKRYQNKDLGSDPTSDPIANQNQNQNQNNPPTPQGGESDLFEDQPPVGGEPPGEGDLPVGEHYTAAFEKFWGEYPNKTGKRSASQAYENAFKRLGGAKAGTQKVHDFLHSRIAAQCRVWRKKGVEGRYIPHPSTWLNQSRYDDPAVAKECLGPLAVSDAVRPEPELVDPAPPKRAKLHLKPVGWEVDGA